jgi:hypothetical protein
MTDPGMAGHGLARQGREGPGTAGSGQARQGKAGPGKAGRGKAGPGKAGRGKAGNFTPSRADGRSDKRVIYQLVQDATPGDTFDYDKLIAALSEGLDVEVTRARVYPAVAAANKTLLQRQRRYLGIVPGVGYRVISAAEHLPVALDKKDRAQAAIKRGIDILRNARLDELDQAQRILHEGQLLILGAQLNQRIDDLEAKT